jgi:ribosome maturation factor RimP
MVPEGGSALADAFGRVVHALPNEAAFAPLEIVETAARRQGGTTEFRVTVDRPGGVDLALCGRIAAHVNAALEAFPQPYTLQVESAGLDRPLVRPSDYERFTGSNVKVITSLLIGSAKTHRGVLAGVRGTNVILQTEKGELPLPLAAITSAKLEYDIRADLARAKRERRQKP